MPEFWCSTLRRAGDLWRKCKKKEEKRERFRSKKERVKKIKESLGPCGKQCYVWKLVAGVRILKMTSNQKKESPKEKELHSLTRIGANRQRRAINKSAAVRKPTWN